MQVSTSQAAGGADSAAGEPPGKAKGKGKGKGKGGKGGGGEAARGASTVSSGVKLEDVSITFKNQQLLRGVSWEVKRGERVGLVGEPAPSLCLFTSGRTRRQNCRRELFSPIPASVRC